MSNEPAPVASPTPEPTPTPTPSTEPTPVPEPSLIEGKAPEVTPEPFVPLTAESIKLPEGFTVNEPVMGEFLTLMNDQKVSPAERAQKLIDLQIKAVTDLNAAGEAAFAEQQTQWQNEVRADPEFANGKLDPALGEIQKLIGKFGTPELKAVMTTTGAGNNIHVVKFLHAVAKQLNEPGPVVGSPASSTATLAEKLYPSMAKK